MVKKSLFFIPVFYIFAPVIKAESYGHREI